MAFDYGYGGAPARRSPSGAAGSGVFGGTTGAAGSGSARARTRTPAPRYNPPVRSTSGGQYSRPVNVPMTGPGPVPDINAFLNADTSYNDQLRQFSQALSDMQADVTRRRGSLTSEYELSTKALADQRLLDLKNLEADYGSRGLLRSGLYGQAVGDYEREYGNRSSDLSRRQNDALSQLQQELTSFTSQQELQKQAAREAAIRRRAEQYGV